MKKLCDTFVLLTAFTATSFIIGCGDSQKKQSETSTQPVANAPPATVETGHDHAHPTEGPHHGNLIELGNEQYHAELIHDDASGTLTVYILDAAAKIAVPITAPELTINITHDGQGEQHKILAKAEKSDPAGKSSRFVSEDKELMEELDHEDATAQLVVNVEGTQLRGAIEHSHEHDDHEHSHE